MRLLSLFVITTTCVIGQKSSFDIDEFIKRVRSSYHSFEIDTTQKISSYLTSQGFNNYYKSKTTEKIKFPVEIDWSNVSAISLKPTEDVLGTSDFKENQNHVLSMASLLLSNWLDFSVNELIPKKAINFSFSQKGNRVYFSYVSQNGKKFDRIAREFAMNGLMLDMSVQTSDRHTIKIQPIYRSIKGKWLCVGWTYQKIDQSQNVIEGMKVDLVQKQIGENWYPFDVRLTMQTTQQKGEPILEQLFFRQYHYQGSEIN